MNKKKHESRRSEDLRRRAEAYLSKKQPEPVQAVHEEDALALVHELQVHQVELEMQNEELRRVNIELDEALRQYSDLYEFAPIGYFTLNDRGVILSVNLAGAKLMGRERSNLIGAPFRAFVAPSSLAGFDAFCRKVLETREKQSFEIRLTGNRDSRAYVLLEAVATYDEKDGTARHCLLSVTDITERRLAEEALRKAHDELEARVQERTNELLEANKALQTEIAERKRAQERERELDAHKLEFYRRTILSATNGKLTIAERDEIEELVGPPIAEWELKSVDDLTTARREATAIAESIGMDEAGINKLATCIGEATSNSYKHAGRGKASLHRVQDALAFKVEDRGPGIEAMSLPNVALVHGYSTVGTLGMGYKMMIAAADKVYLATGPDGTTLACLVGLREAEVER